MTAALTTSGTAARLTEEQRAEIDERYGSKLAGPWTFHKPDGRGYIVRSYGGNDIIAIKHYSPVIAESIVEALIHFQDDIGLLLADIDWLHRRNAEVTEYNEGWRAKAQAAEDEVARLRAALAALVGTEPLLPHCASEYPEVSCLYCGVWGSGDVAHADDCAWVAAQALLAKE